MVYSSDETFNAPLGEFRKPQAVTSGTRRQTEDTERLVTILYVKLCWLVI